jgi:polyhydroxybutyrate depolymerase
MSFLWAALLLGVSSVAGGCEKDTTPPARHFEATMQVNGLNRSYIVNLPPAYYEDTTTYAMVIGLHGTGGNAKQFEEAYGFSKKADEAGFIAVYPNGVVSDRAISLRTWNAGSCCDFAMKNGIDDVAFISNLIDKMTASYRIDHRRVYVTGMSNGGMMLYRLAAELSNKIAAIAPVSGSMVYSPAAGQARPMPILHLHSVLDQIVPYNGGSNRFGYYFPPVDSVLRVWAQRDRCIADEQVLVDDERYKLVQWVNENGDPFIVHYVTKDGGHSWPGGKQARQGADLPSTVINANDLIWDFFSRFRLE